MGGRLRPADFARYDRLLGRPHSGMTGRGGRCPGGLSRCMWPGRRSGSGVKGSHRGCEEALRVGRGGGNGGGGISRNSPSFIIGLGGHSAWGQGGRCRVFGVTFNADVPCRPFFGMRGWKVIFGFGRGMDWTAPEVGTEADTEVSYGGQLRRSVTDIPDTADSIDIGSNSI